MNFPAHFDKIYCINLNRRHDRWKESMAEFTREGIAHGIHRFEAIEGRNLQVDPKIIDPGNAGCTASHAAIMREIIANGWKRTLVFEDDVTLMHGFVNRFFQLFEQVPDDWQMLYLGANHQQLPIPVTPNIGRVQFAYTTHAYMVTLEGAKACLKEAEKIDAAIDFAYTRIQQLIPCYAMFPNLAWQRPSHSDILNRHADYSFMNPY